jgi:hypothetical protein
VRISCDVNLYLGVLAAERHSWSDEPFPVCVSRGLQRLVFLLERFEGNDRPGEPPAAQIAAMSAIVRADIEDGVDALIVQTTAPRRTGARCSD